MKFLIQLDEKGRLALDLCWAVEHGIKLLKWRNNDSGDQIKAIHSTHAGENLIDIIPELKECVPIGSLEFVREYLIAAHGLDLPKPINIPNELLKKEFLGREVLVGNPHVVSEGSKYFVKPMTRHHKFFDGGYNYIYDYKSIMTLPKDEVFLFSEIVESGFESEWRVFVMDGVIRGMQRYLGEWDSFPNTGAIQNMVDAYTDCPPAYTLDVGVLPTKGIIRGDTVVLEVHDFYSCGTYGFHGGATVALMSFRWFADYLRKNGRSLDG